MITYDIELKKRKEKENITDQTESRVVCVATDINTCVACGREIPEGILVCKECEIGRSPKKCLICDRPVAESESVCSNCRAAIFRFKKKYQVPDAFAIIGEEDKNA